MFFKYSGYLILAALAVSASASFSPDYFNYLQEYSAAEVDILEPFWGFLVFVMSHAGVPYWLFHFLIVFLSLWIKDYVFFRHDFRVLLFYLATFYWLHDVVQIRLTLAITLYVWSQSSKMHTLLGKSILELLAFLTHPSIVLFRVIKMSKKVRIHWTIIVILIVLNFVPNIDLLDYVSNSSIGDTKIEFYLWNIINNGYNELPWKYLFFNISLLSYTIYVGKNTDFLDIVWIIVVLSGFYYLPEVIANRLFELYLFTMLWNLRKVLLKIGHSASFSGVAYIPTIILLGYVFTKGLRV